MSDSELEEIEKLKRALEVGGSFVPLSPEEEAELEAAAMESAKNFGAVKAVRIPEPDVPQEEVEDFFKKFSE